MRRMTPLRLITIAISHYCEKARWALDRAGLPYVEEAHPPLLHNLATLRAGGGDTTPVLVTPEETLADSTDILKWIDRRRPDLGLYAAKDAAELEDLFDETLGPHTRRWVYAHVLDDPALTRRALTTGASGRARAAYRVLQPVITFGMRKGLNITPTSKERSRAKVDEVFARVDALLADGRPFLGGDRFGAADLTFAALGAPVVLPPVGYGPVGMDFPTVNDFPAALREEVRPYADRPGGRLILRLYAEERRRPVVAS
jgi:glutathione S-transferase